MNKTGIARAWAECVTACETGVVTTAAIARVSEASDALEGTQNRDGLTAVLLTADPRPGLELAWKSGLLVTVLPEVAALEMNDEISHMHKDNLIHSFIVCAATPARLRVRLIALFHDVGKPVTRKREAGKITFHDHEAVGGRLTRTRMEALGFDETLVESVASLVTMSGRVAGFSGTWTDSAVRRIMRDADDGLEDLIDFTRVDCTSKHEYKREAARVSSDAFAAEVARVRDADMKAQIRPALDGTRIMEIFGLEPGPQVGQAYKHLRDMALDGITLTEAQAEAELRQWMSDKA